MKKTAAILMIGVLCLGTMTGCGKSEEQKALEEIAWHMEKEAEADGIDLEEEIRKTNEEHEAFVAQQEAIMQKNASVEDEVNAFRENDLPVLQENYETFLYTEDTDVIVSSAEAYNEIIASIPVTYSADAVQHIYQVMVINYIPCGINDDTVAAKTVLAENLESSDNLFAMCKNEEDGSNPVIVLANEVDNSIQSMKILNFDGNVQYVDLSSYNGEMIGITLDQYEKNSLILTRQDYMDGNDSLLKVAITSGEVTEVSIDEMPDSYYIWSDTLEGLPFEELSQIALEYFNVEIEL